MTDAQWRRLGPLLEPKRQADGRGRPWQDTRQVFHGVLWVLGTGAQWRELPERYPPYQTCHRRFQQWVRAGVLERALSVLAEELEAQGRLNLDEAFVDATFAAAKKGAWPLGPPSGARAPRSSLSPMATVFLLPLACRALRRTNRNW